MAAAEQTLANMATFMIERNSNLNLVFARAETRIRFPSPAPMGRMLFTRRSLQMKGSGVRQFPLENITGLSLLSVLTQGSSFLAAPG
jgi:hypothetical protein